MIVTTEYLDVGITPFFTNRPVEETRARFHLEHVFCGTCGRRMKEAISTLKVYLVWRCPKWGAFFGGSFDHDMEIIGILAATTSYDRKTGKRK